MISHKFWLPITEAWGEIPGGFKATRIAKAIERLQPFLPGCTYLGTPHYPPITRTLIPALIARQRLDIAFKNKVLCMMM